MAKARPSRWNGRVQRCARNRRRRETAGSSIRPGTCLEARDADSRVMTGASYSLYASTSSMTGARTVLIVDDYLDALDVWAIYLGTEGFRVLTASHGSASALDRERGAPGSRRAGSRSARSLGLRGGARAAIARRDHGHIPLIAATGYSHAVQQDRARAVGLRRRPRQAVRSRCARRRDSSPSRCPRCPPAASD